MRIVLIAAVASNGVIGNNNRLPWSIKRDLEHFKETTSGHPIIMGWKTYASLGRPLPNRTNIVLSRKEHTLYRDDVTLCRNLMDGFAAGKKHAVDDEQTIYVIGGGEVYRQALPYANELILTHVELNPSGEVGFPKFNKSLYDEEILEESVENDIPYRIVRYSRK